MSFDRDGKLSYGNEAQGDAYSGTGALLILIIRLPGKIYNVNTRM
jgi:hypothetical protein